MIFHNNLCTFMNTDKNMSKSALVLTKPVVVQLPIYTHDGSFHVVETTLLLPQDYTPQKGSFFAHDSLPNIGRLNIDWWGYDGRDHKTYIALGVGYQDPTRNIDEWLEDCPTWQLATDPMLTIKERKNEEVDEEDDYNANDWD